MSQQKLHIYTNGGHNAWAIVIPPEEQGDEPLIFSGADPEATINCMQLVALHEAMLYMQFREIKEAVIHAGSRYALSTMQKWAAKWKRNGWRKSGGPITHLALIQEMHAVSQRLRVTWDWMSTGHQNPWNQLADKEVSRARARLLDSQEVLATTTTAA